MRAMRFELPVLGKLASRSRSVSGRALPAKKHQCAAAQLRLPGDDDIAHERRNMLDEARAQRADMTKVPV